MKPSPPARDLELAAELELLFSVATKPARGAPWIDRGEPASLSKICDMAKSLSAFEVGIFVVHRDDSQSVYWTTRAPDVYNTTALEHARWRDAPEP